MASWVVDVVNLYEVNSSINEKKKYMGEKKLYANIVISDKTQGAIVSEIGGVAKLRK